MSKGEREVEDGREGTTRRKRGEKRHWPVVYSMIHCKLDKLSTLTIICQRTMASVFFDFGSKSSAYLL